MDNSEQQVAPPHWQLLAGMGAVAVHHLADDESAARALAQIGLAAPGSGRCSGEGYIVAWHSPKVWLVLGQAGATLQALCDTLGPGGSDHALAVDVSDAVTLLELRGAGLQPWLARLIDADALPAAAGACVRCRFMDIPVLLLRLAEDIIWLAVDHPLLPYVQDWLDYSHINAFSTTHDCHDFATDPHSPL